MKRRWTVAALLSVCLSSAGFARANAEEIVIGAIYSLTGNAAPIGTDAQAAIGIMADIINTQHPAIPMLLGAGGGLPHMNHATIRVIFADHQGDPQKARAEAERLITQEHVAAIIGSYQSATAGTISQVAERYEVPFVVLDSTSPALNQRGLKWFFRTTPHDEMFSAAMFDFFKATGEATGRPVKTAAMVYEDSTFGSDSSTVQKKLAEAAGIKVAADIRYRANSPSLSAEAQRLKAANADVVMPTSYTSDAILLLRSMNEIGYKPPAVMAQAAGFVEQAFLTASGPLAEGVLSRSSFALDAAPRRPAITPVNALLRAKTGRDLNDNTARQLTGFQVLADAIDRSGTGKPADIRTALTKTDIAGDQTIMPWRGVKFDETGQNTEATPIVQQVVDGKYRTVFPANVAVAPPIWNVGK